jgi:hypothetical protein
MDDHEEKGLGCEHSLCSLSGGELDIELLDVVVPTESVLRDVHLQVLLPHSCDVSYDVQDSLDDVGLVRESTPLLSDSFAEHQNAIKSDLSSLEAVGSFHERLWQSSNSQSEP